MCRRLAGRSPVSRTGIHDIGHELLRHVAVIIVPGIHNDITRARLQDSPGGLALDQPPQPVVELAHGGVGRARDPLPG